ncbi:hypothetical protein ACFPER_16740 [Agromyces aurantiacus]|uniref:Uncharacterized protein n=1 Tax=Agromyces aurantiacus TaxID=165814 RepID=A0ABV9RA77_9MICO|nr:hypothetical protein [Agromyces aurantiacus]MBM7504662.1 hypothetical protein [Agromyces aurantiacus]
MSNQTTDAAPAPFTMIGDPSAAVCEGDACLLPVEPESTPVK